MRYNRLCCWDCGARIIYEGRGGALTTESQVEAMFTLNMGPGLDSLLPVPFCAPCVEKPWPAERVAELDRAVHEAGIISKRYTITGFSSILPRTSACAGVFA